MGLPGWLSGKEPNCDAGDTGLIPASGRSPGEGSDNPSQYSCLRNPMDSGAQWAIVRGVTKSQTKQSNVDTLDFPLKIVILNAHRRCPFFKKY